MAKLPGDRAGDVSMSRYVHFDPLMYNNWWSDLLSHLGFTGLCHKVPLQQHMVVVTELPSGIVLTSITCPLKIKIGKHRSIQHITENLTLHILVLHVLDVQPNSPLTEHKNVITKSSFENYVALKPLMVITLVYIMDRKSTRNKCLRWRTGEIKRESKRQPLKCRKDSI